MLCAQAAPRRESHLLRADSASNPDTSWAICLEVSHWSTPRNDFQEQFIRGHFFFQKFCIFNQNQIQSIIQTTGLFVLKAVLLRLFV